MTIHDCEAVRDLLPLLVGGRLDDVRTRAVEEHLRGCAGCAQEEELLRAVARSAEPAPAGLVEGTVAAAARPAPRRQPLWRRLPPVPVSLAAAATFAAALLGGALLYDRAPGSGTEGAPLADTELAWAAGVDDPLVQGAATLAELTEEELELLLAELEL